MIAFISHKTIRNSMINANLFSYECYLGVSGKNISKYLVSWKIVEKKNEKRYTK